MKPDTTKTRAMEAMVTHLLDLLDEAQADLERSLQYLNTELAGKKQGQEDFLAGTLQDRRLTQLAATINAARGLAAAR